MEITKEFRDILLKLEEERDRLKLNNKEYFIVQIDKDCYYENFSGEIIIKGYFIYLSESVDEFNKNCFLYLFNENTENPNLRFFIQEKESGKNKTEAEEKPKIKDAIYFKKKEIKIKDIKLI